MIDEYEDIVVFIDIIMLLSCLVFFILRFLYWGM